MEILAKLCIETLYTLLEVLATLLGPFATLLETSAALLGTLATSLEMFIRQFIRNFNWPLF